MLYSSAYFTWFSPALVRGTLVYNAPNGKDCVVLVGDFKPNWSAWRLLVKEYVVKNVHSYSDAGVAFCSFLVSLF